MSKEIKILWKRILTEDIEMVLEQFEGETNQKVKSITFERIQLHNGNKEVEYNVEVEIE